MNNVAFQIYGSKRSGIFQSTWKTDNAGTSASNQIELPLLSGGTYNFWIDWGDGSTTNVTSYSQRTHTYASAGTYTLRATGAVGIWQFYNGGDKLKILTVSSWGKLILGVGTFYGCSNVTMSGITDVPDLTGVTSLNSTFAYCSLITTIGRLNEWNTSSVTSTAAMFYNCTNFNQNIGSFNLTNCIDINTMLAYCTNFNNGGSSDINNWRFKTTGNVDAYGTLRNMPNFNQPVNNWNTERFSRISTMFYASTSFNQNLNSWNLDNCNIATEVFQSATSFNNGFASGVSTGNQLTWNLPICTLVWNMFASATSFNSNLGNGSTPWIINNCISFGAMFSGATKFNNGDNTAPIANWLFKSSGSISTSSMFNGCIVFNRPLNGLNLSYVTNMDGMFSGCTLFNNGNASGVANQLTWDTSTCTNMSSMFAYATGFNSNLGTASTPWNVSKVTSFTSMFIGTSNFNNGDNTAPINNWNIGGGVTGTITMNQMFQSSKFNRYIGDWDVSKVTAMGNMFLSNTSFNQDISKWNMSSVTSMDAMFYSAAAFTNGSNTNTNPITGLTGINGWNINTTATSVTMTSMFAQNTIFNQPIGSWNVSKVTNMSGMFYNTGAFNQPLVSWNVSKVTNMSNMFYGCPFNQNIGSWNVSNVTGFTNFMSSKTPSTYSSTNLDAIYNGWIVNGVQPNTSGTTNINFGSAKYTSAGAAGRLTLTSAPNNWIIQDGGL